MNINDLDAKDHKFIVKDPKNFNPERNKALVAETLAEYEKYISDIQVEKDVGLMDRIEKLSYYAATKFSAHSSKKFREYLGEAGYRELVGERMLDRIKQAEITNKLKNNTKFSNSILMG